ncbi:hypothetical protein SAMN05660662_3564 [Blastococcus aurantiacus]|uniref:Lipoprotein n=1 Tax=Blastococcus aurantiacus TaxID=1550231 RepID=A0A1G7PDF2_9ACTN|nr:hypothetical protein [Blastococcus aurantiacus]SDF83500.1 hypothetical protein SAMN05660662_3564 [Blastococcus aurantiacus]
MSAVRSRVARTLLGGTVLVLALGGCADEPKEVTQTSGPLAEGFEIEPGSGLVGAVFPHGSIGHQAVLRVDGDLPKVFEGYVRQAQELGYELESGWPLRPEGQWCSDPDDTFDDDPREGPFEVECTASRLQLDEYSVSVRGLADTDGRGYIHLRVQPSFDTVELSPLASDGPVASATDDQLASELTPSTDEPPLHVVEGSELVSVPIPATCITGGFVAVLQVTDELMPVMRGYLQQFTGMTAFTSEGLVGSDDEPRVWASAAGGGDLTAVGVAGDPSYVLIERCND